MLFVQKVYVEGGFVLILYCVKFVDEVCVYDDVVVCVDVVCLFDILMLIVKSWLLQWCVVVNDFVIQVYGGYGYMCDYVVEWFYCDNCLNLIYEGMYGIQVFDLLGCKVSQDDGVLLCVFDVWIGVIVECV